MDDSATTQMDSRILDQILPYFTSNYGNPSSTHSFGMKSRYAIDESRYSIANYLGCTPQEIIFTSTGSESISLALKGTAEYLATINGDFHPENVYFVTSPLEHSAVIKTISHLSAWGYKNKIISVDQNGVVNLNILSSTLESIKIENPSSQIIVTIQHVNSEIGVIQDIPKISLIAKEFGAYFHTDAMQSAKLFDLNVKTLGVDMLTMASHKIYGPIGVGILYLKSGSKISRQTDGGEQEYNIRAGTQNTPAIVGFGKAVELLKQERVGRFQHISKLSTILCDKIKFEIPSIRILSENTKIPSINSILFPQIKSTEFLVRLDLAGIMASAGSACNSGSIQPTANLKFLGLNDDEIKSVIRFSIGKNNTEKEINEAAEIIVREYQKYIQSKK